MALDSGNRPDDTSGNHETVTAAGPPRLFRLRFLALLFVAGGILPLGLLWIASCIWPQNIPRIQTPGETTVEWRRPGGYYFYREGLQMGRWLEAGKAAGISNGVEVRIVKHGTDEEIPVDVNSEVQSKFDGPDGQVWGGVFHVKWNIEEPGLYDISVRGKFPDRTVRLPLHGDLSVRGVLAAVLFLCLFGALFISWVIVLPWLVVQGALRLVRMARESVTQGRA